MRIGLASDTFPTNVPMVIARPTIAPLEEMPPQPVRLREDSESSEPLFGQAFEEGVTKLEAILKARLRAAKKRSVPNARELVASYNRRSQWEQILDINDPEQIEWEDLGSDKKYVTGAQVPPVCLLTGSVLTCVGAESCRGSRHRAALLAHSVWGV